MPAGLVAKDTCTCIPAVTEELGVSTLRRRDRDEGVTEQLHLRSAVRTSFRCGTAAMSSIPREDLRSPPKRAAVDESDDTELPVGRPPRALVEPALGQRRRSDERSTADGPTVPDAG